MDDYEFYMEELPLQETRPSRPARRRRRGLGCSRWMLWLLLALALYFFAPWRTNILVLGIDRTAQGSDVGRSDTIMLLGVQPFSGQVNLLSIPRDLWVSIPGYGESRINSAHSWGELAATGGGPRLAADTLRQNFGVNVSYTLRIRLAGFPAVINALGGMDVTLAEPTPGYAAGSYHFDGDQALAFVRDRRGDDFFRQANGQIFVVAMAKKLLNPLTWLRLPGALVALAQTVDTNIPMWSWPRLGLAMLRAVVFDGLHAVVLPAKR